MKLKKHYYLMISCPGDVVYERELLKTCVENINNERTDDVWVELQYWVTDTSSDASTPAQESINEQIVNECDGLIAIFNARLGTPVHEYKCGTDEEIALMLKANKHVSLLFNTKPVIDLTNPTSIEQITKLQEYKNEQSLKAYYREFSDSESFSVLARREILLWLRGITKDLPMTSLETLTTQVGNSISGNEEKPVIFTKPGCETASADNISIDTEAGALDCVIYITEASTVLTEEIDRFAKTANELNGIVNGFTDRVNFMKKKNSNAGILLACKEFANKINENSAEEDNILDAIEVKWNEIYQYLLIYNKNSLSVEDETILKDAIVSLKQCFIEAGPKIQKLIKIFGTIPNYQKNVTASISKLSSVYKKFNSFTIRAAENCEELEALFDNVANE